MTGSVSLLGVNLKEDTRRKSFKMVLETISKIIKVQLPAYLKKLPLPETIGGFARLTGESVCVHHDGVLF